MKIGLRDGAPCAGGVLRKSQNRGGSKEVAKVATWQRTRLAMGGGMVPISEWREKAAERCRGGKWEMKKRGAVFRVKKHVGGLC
jgi:hypothetical protein